MGDRTERNVNVCQRCILCGRTRITGERKKVCAFSIILFRLKKCLKHLSLEETRNS